MPPLVLRQTDQLTGESVVRLRTGEPALSEACGFELRLGALLRTPDCVDKHASAELEKRGAHVTMPVIALAAACELTSGDGPAATLTHLLAACERRGVKHLNLSFSSPADVDPSPPRGGASDCSAANTAYAVVRNLRHAVEASGVVLALEAAGNSLFLSPAEMRQMIDAVNSWAIGACMDVPVVSTFSRANGWIEVLGRRLRAIRLSTGDHSLDSALAAIHFDGLIILRDG